MVQGLPTMPRGRVKLLPSPVHLSASLLLALPHPNSNHLWQLSICDAFRTNILDAEAQGFIP